MLRTYRVSVDVSIDDPNPLDPEGEPRNVEAAIDAARQYMQDCSDAWVEEVSWAGDVESELYRSDLRSKY